MEDHEFDQVLQLQRLGIGLIVGGVAYGGVAPILDTGLIGSAVLGFGIAIWGIEYWRQQTVGIGLGVVLAGIVVLIETWSQTGLNDTVIALSLIGFGIADYVLAPVYAKIQGAGENIRN